jgi:hypothetical protein
METTNFSGYNKQFDYSFGEIICYDNYVIGRLNMDTIVNTEIATTILTDINAHYGNQSIVYISNREFGLNVDPSVYKLVDPKRIVGIAIVAKGVVMRKQAALEQTRYSGSFGFFNSMESAISWAHSCLNSRSAS